MGCLPVDHLDGIPHVDQNVLTHLSIHKGDIYLSEDAAAKVDLSDVPPNLLHFGRYREAHFRHP